MQYNRKRASCFAVQPRQRSDSAVVGLFFSGTLRMQSCGKKDVSLKTCLCALLVCLCWDRLPLQRPMFGQSSVVADSMLEDAKPVLDLASVCHLLVQLLALWHNRFRCRCRWTFEHQHSSVSPSLAYGPRSRWRPCSCWWSWPTGAALPRGRSPFRGAQAEIFGLFDWVRRRTWSSMPPFVLLGTLVGVLLNGDGE